MAMQSYSHIAIKALLPKALSSTMSLTISSVSEEASLILMLHAAVWCGNFPCGAVIALPPGGWHRFVVPVAALSIPHHAPPQRGLLISPHHTGLRSPSPDSHHDLDSRHARLDPRQGRGEAHHVLAANE